MEITEILPVLLSLASVAIAAVSLTRSKKKDSETEGQDKGVITSDLGYIKSTVDDIKIENREARKEHQTSNERITRCEESVKQAHKRIDTLSEYHKPHEHHNE